MKKLTAKKLDNMIIQETKNILDGGCYSCGAGIGEMHHSHCECKDCMCKGAGKRKKRKGGHKGKHMKGGQAKMLGGVVQGGEAINMGNFKFGGKFKQLQHPFNEVPFEQMPYPYKREGVPYKWWYYI